MLPVLSSLVMKWLPSTSPLSVPWDDIACRCKPGVLCGLSTFLLQCSQDSDYNATLCMKTWIPCHLFVTLYLTMFKFKSQMTGCLSMTGRLQNLPPTTMYNMHIKHSSRATAHLILKWQNQLWISVTVASSGSFELRHTMQRAKAHVFQSLSRVVDARDEGPRRQENKWKAMTPLTTVTPCWERK
jgi:hypothetical protein